MSQDPEVRAKAVARDKFLWDQKVRQRTAREEGIEIGEKRGRKEGLLEAAKKLISSGMDSKTVCEMLGISEADLT